MTNDPSRLVLVASNRGPVSFGFAEDGALTVSRGGGGLVSGLMSGLAAVAADGGVLWLCAALSDADREAARRGHRADGGSGEAQVRMLEIPPDTFGAAYNGVANSVLWFVHHLLFDTPNEPRFGTQFHRDWDAYIAYNESFADALAEEYAPGTRVLIQDYHLALAPRLLPDNVAVAILDGMLGADHAGFLAARWAAAFLDCCEAVLGAQVSRGDGGTGQVRHRGR